MTRTVIRPPSANAPRNGRPAVRVVNDADAEQCVLGAVLLDATALERARRELIPEDFADARHTLIFAAAIRVAENGGAPDPPAVADALDVSGELQRAGGKEYIGWLVDVVPTAANVDYHAGIVLRQAKTRGFGGALERGVADLKAGKDPSDVAQGLRSAVDVMSPGARMNALPVLADEAMMQRAKPAQVVEGIFLERSRSALVGPPGVGKGLIVLDLMYRVASGMDYHGHAVQAGACVYVAMERQGGLGARIRAWKAQNRCNAQLPVYFIPLQFSLFDATGAVRLLEALRQLPPVRIIAIDTAAKAMLPGNENETRDMGAFMSNLQRVTDTGPNVLLVHHLNAAATRERGNTSLRGDTDTVILAKSEGGTVTLECDKQNELEPFSPITLNIVSVADSAAVVTATAVSGRMLNKTDISLLKSLRIAAADEEASTSRWLVASGLQDRRFYESVYRLRTGGYVAKGEGKRGQYRLTLAGESALTAETAANLRSQVPEPNLRNCGGLNKEGPNAVIAQEGLELGTA